MPGPFGSRHDQPVRVNELALLTVPNTATDADIPSQSLAYSLVAEPTAWWSIPSRAFFPGRRQQTNSPSTNIVSVAVIDNGTPALSATNTYTVVVKEVNDAAVVAKRLPPDGE